MQEKKCVLIVDDEAANREALKQILEDEYEIQEAGDGREALAVLAENPYIDAIVLDILMSGMDGYQFLEYYQKSEALRGIPVIVSSGQENSEHEIKCLRMGACDFVRKPFRAEVIRLRLRNAIERSYLHLLEEIRYREQYDELTGLYRKSRFVEETEKLLRRHPKRQFAIIHMDIYQFQLVNGFYGREEGDSLLRHIADGIRGFAQDLEFTTFCRDEADKFIFCISDLGKQELVVFLEEARRHLNLYKEDYDILPAFGVYLVEDRSISVNEMVDKAKLASKKCKGNYVKNYAFYEESFEQDIVKEQLIVNSMNNALAEEEFVLFLQPKYDLRSSCVDGAEVLVRWRKQDGTMFSPGEFIPVFEHNGFIMKLDYYVWEHACRLLRKWLDEGRTPYPISVNMSRVSLYNPNLVGLICELVEKYEISPKLLQLELTESAYTSNPYIIKEAMSELQKHGFSILMDDFGNGYSSLNVLKDIVVDVLKIDMNFLSNCDVPGRSENILASVVRMAKWLDIPVIAEGVEKEEQLAFLKGIGCEYVQGYYLAKPMPVEAYEQLVYEECGIHTQEIKKERVSADDFWTSTSQLELLFSTMTQAVAVYEYDENGIDIIRVNNAYYELFGFKDISTKNGEILHVVQEEYRKTVDAAFQRVIATSGATECEFVRKTESGKQLWVSLRLKYICTIGTEHILFGVLSDITKQKELDKELQKYRTVLLNAEKTEKTILIVDDLMLARKKLISIFDDSYHIKEAANGLEAFKILKECDYQVDLILLDMIMPQMDGQTFLQRKKDILEMSGIPIIIITADDSKKSQIDTLEMGVNDYITKPFVKEVVLRRVNNVLESTKRFGEILQSWNE